MKKILVNKIITPDGTELISKSVHDYVSYTDKNGQFYSVDGGNQYLKRGYDKKDYIEASIYSDAPFKVIRENVYRGGRGKEGNEPLKYTLLKDMSNDWLHKVIEYEETHRPNNIYLPYYKEELRYRKENNIKIEE